MKRTYYKAEILAFTELFIDNDKNKGYDPDTGRDCGVIETVEKNTLAELKKHLIGESNPYGYEQNDEEKNRYDGGYEETERDGTHVSVQLSAYIYKVTEEIEEVEL